ncbi:hypothetical protein [Methylobacterium iners]|uniref:Uncharacterized protein n=1 Tax=Methylobacterium iners TaxID=418707 RepID=A0ABQ4S2Z3_9HYPH|nr:hypothetical protein [Methylobacterium iners]GJD96772.1 hypothetical protein OCOJLMKI_3997 [Methylobacterium iners]
MAEHHTNRRTVLSAAALPFAAIPDFSSPAPDVPRIDDDAELIRLCREHGRYWKIACDWTVSQEASDAATEETSRLCRLIAWMPTRTRVGLAHKARVAAVESGFGLRLAGRFHEPFKYDDKMLVFGLLAELIEMRGPALSA